MASAFLNTNIENLQDQDDENHNNHSQIGNFAVITQGLEVAIPDSYIRIAEGKK